MNHFMIAISEDEAVRFSSASLYSKGQHWYLLPNYSHILDWILISTITNLRQKTFPFKMIVQTTRAPTTLSLDSSRRRRAAWNCRQKGSEPTAQTSFRRAGWRSKQFGSSNVALSSCLKSHFSRVFRIAIIKASSRRSGCYSKFERLASGRLPQERETRDSTATAAFPFKPIRA